VDPDQHPGLAVCLGPAQPALQRRAARLLVRLAGAASLRGSLVGRLGLERIAHPAPGARRRRNIAAATEQLTQLHERLAGPKARLRGAAEIDLKLKMILETHHVGRYLKVKRIVREDHVYKQTRRGRPGPETAYRKITKRRFDIEWSTTRRPSPTTTGAMACTR